MYVAFRCPEQQMIGVCADDELGLRVFILQSDIVVISSAHRYRSGAITIYVGTLSNSIVKEPRTCFGMMSIP